MDIPGFDIRYTYVTDISYLRQWIRSPGMLQWFPMTEEKEVEDALQCWIGFCRWSCSITATVNHIPCGIGTLFLMPYKKVAHHCLFKVIVDPNFQKKGIGNALIRNLKHLAKPPYFPQLGDDLDREFRGESHHLSAEEKRLSRDFPSGEVCEDC